MVVNAGCNALCRRDYTEESVQSYWQSVLTKFTFTIPLKVCSLSLSVLLHTCKLWERDLRLVFAQSQDKPVEVGDAFRESIKDQYASMYLEAIGATPTPENMCVSVLMFRHRGARFTPPFLVPLCSKYVLEHIPIEDAQINTMWKCRGGTMDGVLIQPHFEASRKALAAAHAVFSETFDGPTAPDTDGLPPIDYQEYDDAAAPMRLKLSNKLNTTKDTAKQLSWMPQRFDADTTGLQLETEIIIGTVKMLMRDMFNQYMFPYNAATTSASPSLATVLPDSALAASLASLGSADESSQFTLMSQHKLDAVVQLKRPLQVSPGEIATMQADFLRWFPLESLPSLPRKYQDRVRVLVSSAVITRLVGLLAHYGYWIILRHIHDDTAISLPEIDFTPDVSGRWGVAILQLMVHRGRRRIIGLVCVACWRLAVVDRGSPRCHSLPFCRRMRRTFAVASCSRGTTLRWSCRAARSWLLSLERWCCFASA